MIEIETTGLAITQTKLDEIERTLDEMLVGSKASCVIVINCDDGGLVTARGSTEALDTVSLAALAAGAFASTREIARLIGEPEFTVLFHQGRRHHVHVNVAGEHCLLMTLFDDETTVGMVRLCARKACLCIKHALDR
jgi:predicted regulator of Ras-like GTPase activity (Roadblock/LC7/MglB family)